MIDRYGEAIEADLHAHYGLDLLDFFRPGSGRSFAKLDRLIGGLPARSRLKLAMLDDDEWADQVLDDVPESSGSPSVDEWTQEAALLAAAVDRLGEVMQAVIAGAGGKPPRVKPLPRPRTALDRARQRRARSKHASLVAEVEAARSRAS